MVTRLGYYNTAHKIFICFIGLSLFSAPATAAETNAIPALAPLNYKVIYAFSYAGVNFGKTGIEISQTPTQYDITCDVTSTGIVNAFVKHSSHTTVKATGEGGHYDALVYESNYQTKKKPKYVHMTVKNGEITEEQALPPDNRATRPEVSKEQKDKAVNPLSLIFAMRQGLHDAMVAKKDSFSLLLYDGRRLTQVNFAVIGNTSVPIDKVNTDVVQVDISRKLLEGWTQSELGDGKAKEPVVHAYFSRDARFIPILFEVPMWLGTIRASIAKVCTSDDSCLLGISQ